MCLGAQVTALVRDISRLPSELASRITVIQGDSTVKDDVLKAIKGQDGVIVTLGTRHDLSEWNLFYWSLIQYLYILSNIVQENISYFYPGYTTVMSTSLKNILTSMLEEGVNHISVCLSCMWRKQYEI